MTELVAFLSTGKGTWGHVSHLLEGMSGQPWEKVYLLTNEYGMQNYKPPQNVELIEIKSYVGIKELRDEILSVLKERVKGTEVAVNFISGEGKEHMALMSALMRLGVGFRLVALTKDGADEI